MEGTAFAILAMFFTHSEDALHCKYDWDDGSGGDGNVVDVFMAVMEQYPPKWPRASQPLFSIKAEFKAAPAASNDSHSNSKEASISRTVHCSRVWPQKRRIKISIVARHDYESTVDFALEHKKGKKETESFQQGNSHLSRFDFSGYIPYALLVHW